MGLTAWLAHVSYSGPAGPTGLRPRTTRLVGTYDDALDALRRCEDEEAACLPAGAEVVATVCPVEAPDTPVGGGLPHPLTFEPDERT